MATNAFPVNPKLTAIAMAYRNEAYTLIADQVLPRIDTTKKFKYTQYDVAQGYTVPDTKVGRKSAPNQVDFGGTEVTSEVQDYGLDDPIPMDEIKAWEDMDKPATGGPMDPRDISTMMLEGLIQLDREIRVANQVFNAATYGASNKVTLAGSSQWSDYTNSDPLKALMLALDIPLIRPNALVLGQQAATILQMNPVIVEATNGSGKSRGVASLEVLAQVLGIKKVIVGAGFYNTARKGQPANFARAWGKHAALIYTDALAAQSQQPTFGFTAQWGTKIAGSEMDKKIGLRGGEVVRVGESVKEVICAPDLGYFFQNAVA